MAGVSSSKAGDYSQRLQELQAEYQRNLEKLETEQEKELAKNSERQEGRVRKLEQNQETTRSQNEKNLEEAVSATRETGNETLGREREQTRLALEEKSRQYDRNGRLKDKDVDAVKDQLREAEKSWALAHEKDQKTLASVTDQNSRKIGEMQKDMESKVNTSLQDFRESAQGAYSKAFLAEKEKTADFKNKIEDRYNSLNRERVSELNNLKERNHVINERAKDVERSAARARDENADRIQDALQGASAREMKSVQLATRSMGKENSDLRRQNSALSTWREDSLREQAQGRQQAYNEIENEFKIKQQTQEGAYSADLDRLRNALETTQEHAGTISSENRRKLEAYYTELLRNHEQMSHSDKKDLERGFQTFIDQKDGMIKEQRQGYDARLEDQGRIANELRETAMKKQAQAYGETFSNERKKSEEEVAILQKELQQRKTTADPTLISPAAEESVRNSVVSEYEKVLNEERKRNQRSLVSTNENSQKTLRDIQDKTAHEMRQLRAQATMSEVRDQTELGRYVQEAALEKTESQRRIMDQHEREQSRSEKTHRNEVELVNRQATENEESLKLSEKFRLRSFQSESDFRYRMAQRQFVVRTNEMQRAHEKELAEQKDHYENLLQQVKVERDTLMAAERREKRELLEEQDRSSKHLMKQTEQQNEERMRFLAASYEDRIDRITRTNAKLIQKKS